MDNYFSRTTRSPYTSNLYPPPATSSPYTHSAIPSYRPATSSGNYFHSPQPSPYTHQQQQQPHYGSPYRAQQEHGYPVAQPVNPQHHNSSHYSHHQPPPHTQSPYSHHVPHSQHHASNLYPPHASPSPSPPTASSVANGARSPQPSSSPRPPSNTAQAAAAAAATASPAPGGPSPSPQPPMSLESMKNELEQLQHDIGVQESRLNFCSDSHDAKGAAEAAFRATEMKARTKELQGEIRRRERRAEIETKIRNAMQQKFATAEQAVMEHRKAMEVLKQKLRTAFTVPLGGVATAVSAEPSPSTTGSNSPSASPAPSSSASLFDLIPRFKQDTQRASLALERHVISVDGWKNEGVKSILANVDLSSSAAPSAGSAAPSSTQQQQTTSPPSADNDEELVRELVEILNPVFKESCKEATKAALGVQDEIDQLCKHIINTQQFLGYLAPPVPTSASPPAGDNSTPPPQQ